MDSRTVQLIGVFDPEGKDEGFVYSVNAPRNLWMGALTASGSRMGHQMMAFLLNELIDNDKFNTGDAVDMPDQSGKVLRAVVGEPVKGRDVQAFQAQTQYVYPVSVEVVDGDS